MTQTFKVWDSQSNSMSNYEPYKVYKITVEYPTKNRTETFLGMDRGSCIMQAEVAKLEGDDLMLMQSEASETLWKINKEK